MALSTTCYAIFSKYRVVGAVFVFGLAHASGLRQAVTMPLTLYQRDACHLCDAAIEVLAAARAGDFRSVFIDGDAGLEARYGMRVPVLAAADGCELDWPFTAERVRALPGR